MDYKICVAQISSQTMLSFQLTSKTPEEFLTALMANLQSIVGQVSKFADLGALLGGDVDISALFGVIPELTKLLSDELSLDTILDGLVNFNHQCTSPHISW